MAIWADKNTRVIVQGITGREGTFHAVQCREYGTNVVGGVTPGKGGTKHEGFDVFGSVRDAREKAGANCSLIFVPPPFAADAIMEAADAGVALVVCITEGIPTLDMMRAMTFLKGRPATRLFGPNCPGVITAGVGKAGIIPGHIFREGRVGEMGKPLILEEIPDFDPPGSSLAAAGGENHAAAVRQEGKLIPTGADGLTECKNATRFQIHCSEDRAIEATPILFSFHFAPEDKAGLGIQSDHKRGPLKRDVLDQIKLQVHINRVFAGLEPIAPHAKRIPRGDGHQRLRIVK